MPKFTAKTRRIIVLGVLLLSLVGAFIGQPEILKYGLIGLLTLISSDSDEE